MRANVERLVYSSSASVYGDAVEEPMTEDHPFNNTNFYGATKIAGEAMAARASSPLRPALRRAALHERLRAAAGLSGAYIAVIMKMLDAIDRGEPLVVYGDGSQAYDFVYVGDCAQANVCAMQADTVDRVLQRRHRACARRSRSSPSSLLEVTGSDVGIHYEPAGLTFVKNRIGSTERAATEIGFEARVQLDDGLRKLIEWRGLA